MPSGAGFFRKSPQRGDFLFLSAPIMRGTRTAQTCSLLTGGVFFAEPQREFAYPAGAQEGRHQGFYPLVNHPFPVIVWRRPETGNRCENRGTAVGLLLRLFREIFAIHRYRTATHSGCSAQLFCLVIMHGACELYLSTHFTVGCDDSSHRM